MEYNGLNRVLGSNPAGLHIYREKQHPENTTPAGVGKSLVDLYFYKHGMPPASVFPGIYSKKVKVES